MAFKPISEITQDIGERTTAIARYMDAVDLETGAYLSASRGRTSCGDTKYVLILPVEKPEKFWQAEWNLSNKNRKFIRAWSLKEAMEIGNKRVAKMLAERAKVMG